MLSSSYSCSVKPIFHNLYSFQKISKYAGRDMSEYLFLYLFFEIDIHSKYLRDFWTQNKFNKYCLYWLHHGQYCHTFLLLKKLGCLHFIDIVPILSRHILPILKQHRQKIAIANISNSKAIFFHIGILLQVFLI